MPPSHSKATAVYVNGYNLSSFLKSVQVSAEADTVETSTFGSAAKTYVPGLVDATLSAEGFFDPATGASDQVLSAALGVDASVWTVLPAGDGFGNSGFCLAGIETKYEPGADIGDAVQFSAEAQSKVGAEASRALHILSAETATNNGTSIDNGASSTNGGAGYIQVTGLTGTTPSITGKVQHSVDNSVWVDLVTFTARTTVGAERIAVSGTVNRYVRAQWTITGTTPSITFHTSFARK